VTQKGGTEPAFNNAFHDHDADGVYHCVVCDEPLFASGDKYNSGTGWPSFSAPIGSGQVDNHVERKWLVTFVENRCSSCGAHLGHVFADGTSPSNARHCINSASLTFKPSQPSC